MVGCTAQDQAAVGSNPAGCWALISLSVLSVMCSYEGTYKRCYSIVFFLKNEFQLGGRHSTEVVFALLTRQPRFDSRHSQEFSSIIIDVAEIYHWHFLEKKRLNLVIEPSRTS